MILSGLVFSWIQSANQLAGQFEKAMEVDDTRKEEAAEGGEASGSTLAPKEAVDGSE